MKFAPLETDVPDVETNPHLACQTTKRIHFICWRNSSSYMPSLKIVFALSFSWQAHLLVFHPGHARLSLVQDKLLAVVSHLTDAQERYQHFHLILAKFKKKCKTIPLNSSICCINRRGNCLNMMSPFETKPSCVKFGTFLHGAVVTVKTEERSGKNEGKYYMQSPIGTQPSIAVTTPWAEPADV